MAEIVVTSDNFETEVLESAVPVLIDFWAPWCGPCRMLAPVIEELCDEYDGKIHVGKVNVDDEPDLAAAFRVSSIPTVVLVKDGEAVDTSVGYVPKARLAQMIDAHV